MENKYVSIIIPAYHDWYRLSLCLDALAKQTYPHNKFEVIIINNDPDDQVPAGFVLPENCKIIVEEKSGSYAARNTGLKIAKGEIIGFTDSDCIPDYNWIKNAVNYLINNKACSRIGGNILVFYKSSKPTIVEQFNNVYSFPQKWHVSKHGTSVTANLFTYKYLFDKVGYFDETLMSIGDSRWAKLAGQAGYKLDYAEDVIVRHPARNFSDLAKKERRIGGAEGITWRKNPTILKSLYHFFRSFRLKKKELRFLAFQGGNLNIATKISLFTIKYYLDGVRSYERLKVQLGKKPNRE